MNMKEIGERIKSVRKEAGCNQKSFADSVGITQSTLSSYESGNTLPSLEVLYKIAEGYNVSTDWLLGLRTKSKDIGAVSDIMDFLIRLNEVNEVRYELDIHSHLNDDIETSEDRWYASLVFYGSDTDHEQNASVCGMLESFEGNRLSFESYFSDLDTYEASNAALLQRYADCTLTKKEYERLPFEERMKKRDELMKKRYSE